MFAYYLRPSDGTLVADSFGGETTYAYNAANKLIRQKFKQGGGVVARIDPPEC